MQHLLYFAAATEPADGDVLGVLGIDGWTLLFQILAFLVLVWVLSKWVYPAFVQIIDKREAHEKAAAKAADEAREQAVKIEAETKRIMKEASAEASQIVTTAKKEASDTLTSAEEKAQARVKAMVASAEADIEKQILSAKKALKKETIELVTQATETILHDAADSKVDEALVQKAVKKATQ